MWNLNAIQIFGKTINWPMETALFWLLIAQVALVIFMVVVFAILIRRVKRGSTRVVVQDREEERTLVGIELDTSLVTREFAIGEEFSCDGLVITAHYNKDPYSEILHEIMSKIARAASCTFPSWKMRARRRSRSRTTGRRRCMWSTSSRSTP